ncbi:hypothetical protein RCL1_004254 [Eukaryota sp. TZLM3-RCL]
MSQDTPCSLISFKQLIVLVQTCEYSDVVHYLTRMIVHQVENENITAEEFSEAIHQLHVNQSNVDDLVPVLLEVKERLDIQNALFTFSYKHVLSNIPKEDSTKNLRQTVLEQALVLNRKNSCVDKVLADILDELLKYHTFKEDVPIDRPHSNPYYAFKTHGPLNFNTRPQTTNT